MLTFLRLAVPLAAAIALAPAPRAQGTTGVAGVNDYTISGLVFGSASCAFITVPAFTPQIFTIWSAPNVPVLFLFSVSPNCPCRPCFLPFPPQACPVPPNTLCPPTNNSLDLGLLGGCPLVAVPGTTDAAGIAVLPLLMPGPGATFGTQGIAAPPCSNPFQFTQAYQIITV